VLVRYILRRRQEADPIPEWLGQLIEKVEAFGGPTTRIGQVLCTEYDVGVGISWHRDKPHFDKVFGLSLARPASSGFEDRPTRSGNGSRWRLGHVQST